MNLYHLKIAGGYKNMTDNTSRQWQKKNRSGYVTSISDKKFNFDEFILF